MGKRLNRLRVSIFFRKPRPNGNYSVERLFDAVSAELPPDRFEVRRLICPFESNGMIRRFLLVIWAAFHQGDVNHITGDVNFIGLMMRRSKTVQTILDTAPMKRLSGCRRKFYEWIWLRMPIYRAGHVTVISEETLKETFSHISADRNKFHVIPCCVTGGLELHPKPFDTVSPRILHVGTNPNKNLIRVIEAVAGIPCCLVIIGPLFVEQEQLLRSKEIVFENYVGLDDKAMAQQYQLADMVMFVSTYEGFGLPIIEANAVGRPVITSTLSSMPDVAGDAALLVDPYDVAAINDAVLRVISEPDLREKLVLNGRKNIERFTPQKIATLYAQLYDQVYEENLRRIRT